MLKTNILAIRSSCTGGARGSHSIISSSHCHIMPMVMVMVHVVVNMVMVHVIVMTIGVPISITAHQPTQDAYNNQHKHYNEEYYENDHYCGHR